MSIFLNFGGNKKLIRNVFDLKFRNLKKVYRVTGLPETQVSYKCIELRVQDVSVLVVFILSRPWVVTISVNPLPYTFFLFIRNLSPG